MGAFGVDTISPPKDGREAAGHGGGHVCGAESKARSEGKGLAMGNRVQSPTCQSNVTMARTPGPLELPPVDGVSSIAWVPDQPDILVAG